MSWPPSPASTSEMPDFGPIREWSPAPESPLANRTAHAPAPSGTRQPTQARSPAPPPRKTEISTRDAAPDILPADIPQLTPPESRDKILPEPAHPFPPRNEPPQTSAPCAKT